MTKARNKNIKRIHVVDVLDEVMERQKKLMQTKKLKKITTQDLDINFKLKRGKNE